MAKFDVRRLTAAQKKRFLDVLEGAVVALKDAAAVREFFAYLLTPSELAMLGRRLLIAQALVEGKTYVEIRKELGVGLTTVQFVDRWLRVTAAQYRYGDVTKRRQRSRILLSRRRREAIAREARQRPAGIFWLHRALGI